MDQSSKQSMPSRLPSARSKFDVGEEEASGIPSVQQGSNQLAAIHQSHKKQLTWTEEAVVGVPNLADEIHRYIPGRVLSNGPRLGLVVRRMPTFAVVYSKKYELMPLKRDCFASDRDFEMTCMPGTWIRCNFAKVLDAGGLVSRYMCVGAVESSVEPPVPTHYDGGFVRLKVYLDFSLLSAADPTRSVFIVPTDVGDVFVPATTRRLLGLDDSNPSVQSLWVVHIQKSRGCYWLLVAERRFYELADDYKKARQLNGSGCNEAQRPSGGGGMDGGYE